MGIASRETSSIASRKRASSGENGEIAQIDDVPKGPPELTWSVLLGGDARYPSPQTGDPPYGDLDYDYDADGFGADSGDSEYSEEEYGGAAVADPLYAADAEFRMAILRPRPFRACIIRPRR